MDGEEIKLSIQMDTSQVPAGTKAIDSLGAAADRAGQRLRDASGRFVKLGSDAQQAATAIQADAAALGVYEVAVEKATRATKTYAEARAAAARADFGRMADAHSFQINPEMAAFNAVRTAGAGPGVAAGNAKGGMGGGDMGSSWSTASAGAMAYARSLQTASKGAGSFNYQLMAVAGTLDDLQYVGEMGLRPILNNLTMIHPAAGALVIIGNQIYKHWEPLSTLAKGIGKEFGWISDATTASTGFARSLGEIASGLGAVGKAAKDWISKDLVDEIDALSGGPKRREKATIVGFMGQQSEDERIDAATLKKTIDSVSRSDLMTQIMAQRAKASPDFAKEGDARETEKARIIGIFEKAQTGDRNANASARQLLKGTSLESKLADNDPRIQEQRKRETKEYEDKVRLEEEIQEQSNQEILDKKKKAVDDALKYEADQKRAMAVVAKKDTDQELANHLGGLQKKAQAESVADSNAGMARTANASGLMPEVDRLMMEAQQQAQMDPKFQRQFRPKVRRWADMSAEERKELTKQGRAGRNQMIAPTLEEQEQMVAGRNAEDDQKLKDRLAKQLVRNRVVRDPAKAAGIANMMVNEERKKLDAMNGDQPLDKNTKILETLNETLQELKQKGIMADARAS